MIIKGQERRRIIANFCFPCSVSAKQKLKVKYQEVKNSAGDASNQLHCPGNGRPSRAETRREFEAVVSQKTRPMWIYRRACVAIGFANTIGLSLYRKAASSPSYLSSHYFSLTQRGYFWSTLFFISASIPRAKSLVAHTIGT